jgi:hypothetical protein
VHAQDPDDLLFREPLSFHRPSPRTDPTLQRGHFRGAGHPLAQFLASRLAASGKREQVVVTHVPLSFDAELKDDFFNAFAQSCVRASKTKHVVLIGLEFTETDLLNFKTEVIL